MIDLKSNVPADLFTELHSAEGSAGAPARAPDREATVGRWRGGVGWIRPGEPKRGTWWWFLALTAAALLVRLHWNLEVHPPGDYIYSDMRGYMSRASRFFERGLKPDEYEAFYPYGTHMFLWLLQVIFGRDNHSAMAVVYAVIGAGTVGWTYALAARVSRFVWVAPAVGLTLVFYYPLIALGGYFLSETPSSLFLVGSTYFLIRLIDEGGWKHAFMAGLMVALGFPFRPQLVVPVALFAPVWLIYRKRMPNVTIKRLLVAVAPLLVVVALSSWRMHHHTERFGLISENGLFNQVFGRCHNKSIVAMPDGKGHGKTSFGPPAHIQLSKRDQDPKKGWPQLDPALGLEFEFRGYIADREILQDYIHKCVAKTGTFKQIEYTVVNMLLLWRYNVMWPDSGKREWVPYARLWALIVVNAFAVPPFFALLALFFPRHWLKLGVVSLHLVALLIVGGMYMGSFRIRTLYDPILLLLAFEVYAVAVALLATAVQRHVVPRFAKGGHRRLKQLTADPPRVHLGNRRFGGGRRLLAAELAYSPLMTVSVFESSAARHPRWREVPDATWSDWRWQLRNRVTTREELEQLCELTEDERAGIEARRSVFPFAITPYYLSLMDASRTGGTNCPIRRQAVPSAGELVTTPWDLDDPLGEEAHSPTRILTHRYPDRALLYVTHNCPVYCRHCTRQRKVGDAVSAPSRADLDDALAYLERTPAIKDVLVSGGDPLSLSDERLAEILGRLRAIRSIEVIRLCTRNPVTLPQRVTSRLIASLRPHHPVFVSTHFNHPKECTREAAAALNLLADGGFAVGNQMVLLRGINDDAATVETLNRWLLRQRCRPYYIFQCDPVGGTAHLRTPLRAGVEILDRLRGRVSGLAIPQLAVDLPEGGGKVTLVPPRLVRKNGPDHVFRSADGREFTYVDGADEYKP